MKAHHFHPLLLASLALPALADVRTVGPPGSGADFQQIQPAIGASQPGDVVLVAAGLYSDFVLNKPILVQGAGPDETIVVASTIFDSIPSAAVIEIEAGEAASIAGMTIAKAEASAFNASPGAQVEDCAGTVVLHDIDFDSVQGREALLVVGTTAAVVSASYAVGGGIDAGFAGVTDPVFCMSASDSRFLVVDSLVESPPDLFLFTLPSFNETAGFQRSDVLFAGSTVVGANMDSPFLIEGGDAVWSFDSNIEIAGSLLRGGQGQASTSFVPGGYGLRLAGLSAGLAYADGVVQGGLDGDGLVEQDPLLIEPGSSFVQSASFLPTIRATVRRSAPGETIELVLSGAPSSGGQLFASIAPGAALEVPGLAGEVFVDLGGLVDLGPVTLDAAGQATVALPATPALAEPTLATFQWLEAGAGAVSAPAYVSLLP
ncbi:MAG: hypothetical protein AAF682_18355 [Planctomycetota bacterium]